MKKLRIPFKENGDMMWQDTTRTVWRDAATGKFIEQGWGEEWREKLKAALVIREEVLPIYKENFVFTATLKLENFSTGRSAINGIFVDTVTGFEYIMPWSQLQDVLINRIEKGLVTGAWTFSKHGAYYSLVPA